MTPLRSIQTSQDRETITHRQDYAVYNPKGVCLRTFDDAQPAHDWVKAHVEALPGIAVYAVTITETRRRVEKPKARIAVVA